MQCPFHNDNIWTNNVEPNWCGNTWANIDWMGTLARNIFLCQSTAFLIISDTHTLARDVHAIHVNLSNGNIFVGFFVRFCFWLAVCVCWLRTAEKQTDQRRLKYGHGAHRGPPRMRVCRAKHFVFFFCCFHFKPKSFICNGRLLKS